MEIKEGQDGDWNVRFIYSHYFIQVAVIADSEERAIEYAEFNLPFALEADPLEIEAELMGTYA